jgi:3-hydroxybutyryl-CoA dehydratase
MSLTQNPIALGYHFERRLSITQASIVQYATLCEDFNPLHHDEAYAKTTRFGGLIASGPHIVSVFTAFTATHLSQFTQMVGLEFSFKFLSAVHAGDELDLCWTITSLKPNEKMRGVVAQLEGEVKNSSKICILSQGAVLLIDQL